MSCEKILNEYLPFFDKKKISADARDTVPVFSDSEYEKDIKELKEYVKKKSFTDLEIDLSSDVPLVCDCLKYKGKMKKENVKNFCTKQFLNGKEWATDAFIHAQLYNRCKAIENDLTSVYKCMVMGRQILKLCNFDNKLYNPDGLENIKFADKLEVEDGKEIRLVPKYCPINCEDFLKNVLEQNFITKDISSSLENKSLENLWDNFYINDMINDQKPYNDTDNFLNCKNVDLNCMINKESYLEYEKDKILLRKTINSTCKENGSKTYSKIYCNKLKNEENSKYDVDWRSDVSISRVSNNWYLEENRGGRIFCQSLANICRNTNNGEKVCLESKCDDAGKLKKNVKPSNIKFTKKCEDKFELLKNRLIWTLRDNHNFFDERLVNGKSCLKTDVYLANDSLEKLINEVSMECGGYEEELANKTPFDLTTKSFDVQFKDKYRFFPDINYKYLPESNNTNQKLIENFCEDKLDVKICTSKDTKISQTCKDLKYIFCNSESSDSSEPKFSKPFRGCINDESSIKPFSFFPSSQGTSEKKLSELKKIYDEIKDKENLTFEEIANFNFAYIIATNHIKEEKIFSPNEYSLSVNKEDSCFKEGMAKELEQYENLNNKILEKIKKLNSLSCKDIKESSNNFCVNTLEYSKINDSKKINLDPNIKTTLLNQKIEGNLVDSELNYEKITKECCVKKDIEKLKEIYAVNVKLEEKLDVNENEIIFLEDVIYENLKNLKIGKDLVVKILESFELGSLKIKIYSSDDKTELNELTNLKMKEILDNVILNCLNVGFKFCAQLPEEFNSGDVEIVNKGKINFKFDFSKKIDDAAEGGENDSNNDDSIAWWKVLLFIIVIIILVGLAIYI